jgi:hypothetical protein
MLDFSEILNTKNYKNAFLKKDSSTLAGYENSNSSYTAVSRFSCVACMLFSHERTFTRK